MLKLFSKLGTASGLLTGTFVINFDKVLETTLVASGNKKSEEVELQAPENIVSLDDIKLFERKYGCSFIFVKSWKNEHYRFEEFLEKEKTQGRDWKAKVIEGANYGDAKEKCKKGLPVTLFNGPQKGFVSDYYDKFRE